MMANFVDDGFKDEEVQVNESNNKGPTGFSALKYVQPTDVTPGYSTVSDADIVVLNDDYSVEMTYVRGKEAF